MKKKTVSFLSVLSVLLAVFLFGSGCSLFNNGESTSTLSITGESGETIPRAFTTSRDFYDSGDGLIAFNSANIALERIELKLLGDETLTDVEAETMFPGPYTVDLLADFSTQEIGSVVIPAGTYSKIEFELTDALTGGYSVVIEGTYTPSAGSPATFTYTSVNTEDFKIEDVAGFTIEGDDVSIILSFDLDAWFTGVDFSTATAELDGSYLINKTSNNDLADIIEANIEAAGDVGIDDDGDGSID